MSKSAPKERGIYRAKWDEVHEPEDEYNRARVKKELQEIIEDCEELDKDLQPFWAVEDCEEEEEHSQDNKK